MKERCPTVGGLAGSVGTVQGHRGTQLYDRIMVERCARSEELGPGKRDGAPEL